MGNRLLFYDVNGRGLSVPSTWRLSEAADRYWLARDGMLIPLPDSLRQRPARLSPAELDAIQQSIPGARWCQAPTTDPNDAELSDQGATR